MLNRLSIALFLLAVLVSLDVASAGNGPVRMADEDWSVAVKAAPYQFVAGATGGTLVTANVYYKLEARSILAWETVVANEQGDTVRTIPGSRKASPGETLSISQSWDGRADDGARVPPGFYRATVRVRVAPAARVPRQANFQALAGIAEAEEIESGIAPIQVVSAPNEITTAAAPPEISPSSLPPPPGEPGFPFSFYFGSLHNQTSYTDGGHANDATCSSSTTHLASDFTPAQAYNYARNTARLDFLGITDHNHLFDTACPGCSSATVIQRYHDGLNAAAAANVDGSFVAIYGMEWGYISNDSFPNEGHVNLFEIPKLFGWKSGFYEVFTDPAGPSYPALYTAAKTNPSPWGAFGSFNHAATGAGGDFNQFGYTADGDDVIAMTAIISGPAAGFSVTQADTGNRYAGPNLALYPSWATYDVYNRILGAGFHVAPVADPDVHCSNYGTSTHDRTVILATALTKASIFDAIKNRRVYATSDATAQLVFTLKESSGVTHYMGEGYSRTAGPLATSGAITLHTRHYNVNGKTATSIKIFEPVPNNLAGESTLIASGTASPFDFTFTPPAGKHTYYVYVTQNDGAEIWSAPIWINHSAVATPDFSLSATPGSQSIVQGASTTYTATVSPSGGFTGTVSFSASGLPAGATASFSPASVTTSGSSTMTVATSASTPAGTFTITISGTSGALVRSTTVSLVVTPPATPDFTVTATPSSQTVAQGASTTYSATVTPSGGFTGTVTFSASGLPSGATASFSPASVTTSGSSTMTVATAATTPAGTYVVTLSGTSGSLVRSTTVSLVVTAPDFSLSVTPSSVTVPSTGGTATYTVNINRTGGFTAGVTLSVSALPAGTTGAFSPNPATAASSTLTLTVGSGTAAGSYLLTVTGTGGSPSLTRTATATLVKSGVCTDGECP